MYEDIVGYQRQGQGGRGYAQVGLVIDPNGNLVDGNGRLVAHQGYAPEAQYDQPYNEIDALNTRLVQEPQMAIRERRGLRLQRQWYGFPRTEICAGETVKIRAQAEVLMKIIRLWIGDDVNTNLLVHELTIAKNNLINGDAVSAVIFSPLAQTAYPQTATETIQPGCSATITLENVGDTKLCVTVSCDVGLAW